MSKGANSQAGFNAQNWAALSLFVQYSGYAAFEGIELEQPKLADFVLVFKDKRIICESKKSHVTYAELRNILDTIPDVGIQDEILIICTSAGPRLKEDLENARYFPQVRDELVKKHQFTARHLEMLPKVKLWVVDQSLNNNIVRNLLAERFQSWLPDDELDDLVSSLLVENIYNKSAKSAYYSRTEFNDELAKRKEALQRKDDYRHAERSAKDKVNKVLAELRDVEDSRFQSENRLKAIVADTGLHYFALREITKMENLNLSQWHSLWSATFSSYYAREVMRIFKDHITSESDAEYVVSFLKVNIHRLRFRSMEEYDFKDAADILMKAAPHSTTLREDIFTILKKLFEYSTEDLLFTEHSPSGRSKWLKEELAKAFYGLFKDGDQHIKKNIIEYVYKTFDIVDEDSNYWHRTPFQFFEVVKEDLLEGSTKFTTLLSHLQFQYLAQSAKFGLKYDGWELMGGSVSNFGGDFAVHDKAFIDKIIRPYLDSLDATNKWKIVDEYVALQVSDVTAFKPDFMNRALIPFLVEQYATGSDKAFKILSRFIGMRKGIPNKAELIFYYTRGAQNLNLDKKWGLLQVAIKEFGFPINVFMDQVMQELLEHDYPEAVATFSSLIDNKEYMGRQILFDTTVVRSIEKVLSTPSTFSLGIDLLKKFLHSEYFATLDSFHSYDAKSAILTVLNVNFEEGAELLRSLVVNNPSENQQRVFGATLRDTPDELLDGVFKDIVKPQLRRTKTAAEFARLYTNVETRENFIWFAEKLSKKHKFESSFYIVEFFMGDPSPSKGSDYDKEVISGKHDLSINTVRGCLAWALLQVNSIPGRPYINRAFDLIKKLCTDDSLYVRQMSLLALEALANNRHTTMPNSKEWFMDYTTAEGIEKLAFKMLRDKTNYYNAILRHLARVFSRIRTLDEKQAAEVIRTFVQHGDDEVRKELDTFIIFMAEFRSSSFKDWPKSRGVVPPYDPRPIQAMLKDFLKNGTDEHRESLVWHLVKLPEEPVRNKTDEFNRFFDISMKYLVCAIKKYDHHMYSSVHRFIESYIDKRFEDCYKLWKMSLEVERPAIIAETKKGVHPGEYNWWPYHYNGSILVKVLQNKGIAPFLEDIEYIVDYPDEVTFAYDFDKVLAELEKLDTNKDDVKRIYEKIVSKNYLYNDSYDRWLADKS